MAKKKKSNKPQKSAKKAVKKVKPYVSLGKKNKYIGLGIFVLTAIVLYFMSFQYGYVLDDKLAISENKFTKAGFSGIWNLLTTDTFMGYLGEENDLLPGGRYRPLSLISFAIEHQFFGLNPKLSHFINVILYGIAGFISWVTLRRLFSEKNTTTQFYFAFSFLVAIMFVAHPIHTEAVANIKGRDEIMSYIFSLMTLSFALKYIDGRKLLHIAMMALTYFLGLLSKENTITFLLIIPVALLLFRKNNLKHVALITGVLLSLTACYLMLRFSIIDFKIEESTDVMNNPFVGMNSQQKYATISYTLLKYLGLTFVPNPLTHDYYPYHIPILDFTDWRALLSVGIHILLLLAVPLLWKKHKKLALAIIYYVASMSIVSNIVVGVGTFMNERFAFTASLASCIAIVYLSQKGAKNFSESNHTGLYITAIVITIYAALTMMRIPVWETELTLNTAAVKVSKNSARSNSFMATALFNTYKETQDANERKSLILQAEPYATKAASILPNYKNANIMLSGIAAEKYKFDKDLDSLLKSFRSVAARRPDVEFLGTYLEYLNGRADSGRMADFYVELAEMLKNQNRSDWSMHYLLLADNGGIYDNRIREMIHDNYIALGNPTEAEKYK